MDRFELRVDIEVDQAFIGHSRDINLSGLFVETPRPYHPGDHLDLTFSLPGAAPAIRAPAVVVRSAPGGVGLRFRTLHEQDQRHLRRGLVRHASALGSRETARRLLAARGPEASGEAEVRAVLSRLEGQRATLRILPDGRPGIAEATITRLAPEGVHLALGEPLSAEGHVYVLATISFTTWALHAPVRASSDRHLVLGYPTHIAHADRRADPRRPLPDTWLEVVDARGVTLRLPVLDRSAEGLSVRAPQTPEGWAPGSPLPRARLRGPGLDEAVEGAVVRNLRPEDPSAPGGATRLGVQFGVPRGPLDLTVTAVADKQGPLSTVRAIATSLGDWITLKWRARELATAGSGERGLPELVSFPSTNGLHLVGLLQRTSQAGRLRAPLVLILPGFASRKESMSYLATTIVEAFRQRRTDVAVLRVDGTNNLGESGKDQGCDEDGRHTLHYTVGGVAEDARACVAWARSNPLVEATEIIVVSVSFASCGVMRWLATDNPPEVRLWVSYMGASDAQDAVHHVSGHYDVVASATAGLRLGLVTLLGSLVDAGCFWRDLDGHGGGGLAASRRDLAAIHAEVFWMAGLHDAFMDRARVRDLMSVAAPGRRRLLEVDSGHVPRTGEEARRQFAVLAGEIWASVHKQPAEVRPPTIGEMEARRAWEWARTKRSRLEDPRSFWRDYLLGDGGYDTMIHLPAYRTFVDQHAAAAAPAGKRVLDVGAGTGNITAALVRAGAREVVAVDLLEEALAVARTKAPGVRTLARDLDGTPESAVLRWSRERDGSLDALVDRWPGLSRDVAVRLRALPHAEAWLRGDAERPPDPAAWSALPATDRATAEGLRAACRASRAAAPAPPSPHPASLLPFPDASFDAATAGLLLSYLAHPQDLLAELARVVRPGGLVVLSTMRDDADTSGLFLALVELLDTAPDSAFASREERLRRLEAARAFHSRGATLFRLEEEGTFRFFRPDELQGLAREAGLEPLPLTLAFGAPPQAMILPCRRP